MGKNIYVLGISESHGASACLLKNGTIVGAYNEERFNRKKNYLGYPKQSIKALLADHKIHSRDLDRVVLSFQRAIYIETGDTAIQAIDLIYKIQLYLTYKLPILNTLYNVLYEKAYLGGANKALYQQNIQRIAKDLKIPENKITSYPHHLNHAASAVYALSTAQDKALVLTNDGAGDKYCASVNVFKNHSFKTLSVTKNEHSLASLYAHMTVFLGMRANEHEYKIMGLAPYVNPSQHGVKMAYKLLSSLHKIQGLRIQSSIDERHFQHFLQEKLRPFRFDCIAYAIQKTVEDKLTKWVQNAVSHTKLKTVFCGGGIFMNVKANKAIAELPSVKHLSVMPSSSDESTALGAAYLGYVDHCKKHDLPIRTTPIADLYLGNAYTNTQIQSFITKKKLKKTYTITKHANPEQQVASLLAKGQIVARFAGRMEFGHRALGNRSILANPSNRDIIRTLNEQIKSRDFWMPFAGSILKEDENTYLVNPKKLDGSYMIMSFDTKKKRLPEIISATHPYDHTIRPQVVTKEMNPRYHALISAFKKKTGIGAVLNTSLNIHGEPIVCSLEDVFRTFKNSGLQYLQLENYIIQKKQ